MEPSPLPSKSRRSDHDYFVSSETTNSWKTEEARLKDGASASVVSDPAMTSNRKPEDEFEVVEEEMVENMMLEQEANLNSNGGSPEPVSRLEGDEKCSMQVEDSDNNELSDADKENERKTGAEVSNMVRMLLKNVNSRRTSSSSIKSVEKMKTSAEETVPKPATRPPIRESTPPDVANEPRRTTNESSDRCLSVESDQNGSQRNICDVLMNDSENDTSSKVCDSSTMSTASGDDSIDFGNEPVDEMDMSDVSSSFAESESLGDVSSKNKSSLGKKPRRRQPPIMIGYKKRRKVTHLKKLYDEYDRNGLAGVRILEGEGSIAADVLGSSSSEEDLFVGANSAARPLPPIRRSSSLANEPSDKYCWSCHKDAGVLYKCLACPRTFHIKCYAQMSGAEFSVDPENFQCPECTAILRADNINTRSPTLATVNLDQLCVSLKHVIDILKAQKDSHFFLGPVDTKEFPHYREYVTHPMDLTMLEKNVSNKIYGCTEAFLADVKWIVHNSIVFNSKASKVTNVAKNLLKISKREIVEIETCAECYYNSLVRIDTWFIEVCKRPHILVWARLKGYPPWPAKALKCKDSMIDCRFFGQHDKAWVPLKDCFLYSKIPPQPAKVKKSNHLELGIQELEKHIFKLKDKFGIFKYPPPRTPYQPAIELDQIKLMLPNYDPKTVGLLATKYLIHPDRVKVNITPKTLFNDKESPSAKEDSDIGDIEDEKRLEEGDSESTCTDDQDKPLEVPAQDESPDTDISVSSSENESSHSPDDDPAGQASAEPVKCSLSVPRSNDSNTVKLIDNTSSALLTPSSSKSREGSRKSSEETGAGKPRKYVAVRDIDSINASVVERKDSTEIVANVSSSTSAVKVSALSRANSPSTTPVPASTNKSILLSKLTAPRKRSVENASKDPPSKSLAKERKDSSQFDLDKVKDEPIDLDAIDSGNDEPIVEKQIGRTTRGLHALFNVPLKLKRPAGNDDKAAAAKKLKPDSSHTSSVNISKNVTLSVVNRSSNADDGKSKVTNMKSSPPTKMSANYITLKEGTNSMCSKMTPSPVFKVVPSATPAPPRSQLLNKTQVKILPRPTPQSAMTTNGPTSVAAEHIPSPGVTVSAVGDAVNVAANTLKVDSTCSKQSSQELDEILLNEYQTHFKKFFEDTLDKIAGKGDLRVKINGLQKEIENLKKSQEVAIYELRKEYETQIAEFRATSIAKTQFDLATERLKFEQEKEKAVKEAKSKQWCSNCQKSANYYCCWNTAYCDFECQKEHWMSHMQVCKNDVKKKAAAESSENEPPRIMMQNDVSNTYMMNGFDKPGTPTTYAYQNSNSVATVTSRNFKRQPTKMTTTKTNYRPLLPRISPTSSSSSPSVSAVSSTHLLNSTQSFSDSTTYPAVSSTSSLRPVPSAVPVRQTTQFHK